MAMKMLRNAILIPLLLCFFSCNRSAQNEPKDYNKLLISCIVSHQVCTDSGKCKPESDAMYASKGIIGYCLNLITGYSLEQQNPSR